MFFFPFKDDNPTSSRPIISWALISICSLIFFYQLSLSIFDFNNFVRYFGITPFKLINNTNDQWFTVLSSMFVHGNLTHLAGNMVYLWIFGDNIEDSMGSGKFIIFYLLSGIGAAFLQAIIDPSSSIPMIGASGAIAGVLGGYLLLHPKSNVNVLMWIIIFISVIRVPAFIVLGFWIVGQFFNASFGSEGGVAYFAHIGGFIAGMLLIPFFKRADVSLFQEAHSQAFQSSNVDFNNLRSRNSSDDFMQDFIDSANKKDKN